MSARFRSTAAGNPFFHPFDLHVEPADLLVQFRLEEAGIQVSRDGRGRALDNVFVERLWRSVKYEDIYIKDYERVNELESGLRAYFWFYDEERPHQSLDYRTPGEVHRAGIHAG